MLIYLNRLLGDQITKSGYKVSTTIFQWTFEHKVIGNMFKGWGSVALNRKMYQSLFLSNSIPISVPASIAWRPILRIWYQEVKYSSVSGSVYKIYCSNHIQLDLKTSCRLSVWLILRVSQVGLVVKFGHKTTGKSEVDPEGAKFVETMMVMDARWEAVGNSWLKQHPCTTCS